MANADDWNPDLTLDRLTPPGMTPTQYRAYLRAYAREFQRIRNELPEAEFSEVVRQVLVAIEQVKAK